MQIFPITELFEKNNPIQNRSLKLTSNDIRLRPQQPSLITSAVCLSSRPFLKVTDFTPSSSRSIPLSLSNHSKTRDCTRGQKVTIVLLTISYFAWTFIENVWLLCGGNVPSFCDICFQKCEQLTSGSTTPELTQWHCSVYQTTPVQNRNFSALVWLQFHRAVIWTLSSEECVCVCQLRAVRNTCGSLWPDRWLGLMPRWFPQWALQQADE